MQLILTIALVLAVSEARADQWVSPSAVTLQSPNKKWVAVIVPSKDPKVGAHATIGPVGGPSKTITLDTKWMPVGTVLFDDGTLLTLDHWHQLGHGKVAQLYERDGTVRWSKTLLELVGQTFIETVDHSVSSIWWRKMPLEWSLSKDGKRGLITLFDENQLELTIKDGGAIIVISNVPDDPVRQFNRARALARQDGQQAAALAILSKLLAKDPENYETIYLYLQVAQRMNDHALAVATLDKLSPQWKRTDQGYSLANVCMLWSTSLVAMSRTADAERVLERGVAAAAGYATPAVALAALLYDTKRGAKADRVLDDFVARLLAKSYVDYYGLSSIGDFYQLRKEPKKALAIYLKGYKPTEITSQFLYTDIAEAYEQLGKLGEAIRIHEQLRAYFKKQGSAFDRYLKSTEAELVRLRAKQQP